MKVVAVVFLMVAGWTWLGFPSTVPEISPLTADESQQIFQATVRIEIEYTNEQGVIEILNGLGSVMRVDGVVMIVTHNHWGAALKGAYQVRIITHDQQLVIRLSEQQFQAAILLADPGTLIFRAPGEITRDLTPIAVDLQAALQAGRLKPGAVVHAIHCQKDEQRTIVVTALEIEAIDSIEGTPIIRMHNLDGQLIKPGDSGGGIWLNGRIMGNMWAVESNEVESPRVQISFAAIMPLWSSRLVPAVGIDRHR